MGRELDTYLATSQNSEKETLQKYARSYQKAKSFWLSFKDKIQIELGDEWYYGYSDNGIIDSFNVNMFGYLFKISFIFKPEKNIIRHYIKAGTQFNPEWKDFGDIIFYSNAEKGGSEKDTYIMKLLVDHLKRLKESIEK